LTTLMPDGQPQTTAVWCSFDGTHVLVQYHPRLPQGENMRLNQGSPCCADDLRSPYAL
jgi:hypothetical protein